MLDIAKKATNLAIAPSLALAKTSNAIRAVALGISSRNAPTSTRKQKRTPPLSRCRMNSLNTFFLSVGGPKCYACGRSGHIAKLCPDAAGTTPTQQKCYTCGEVGHISRQCPTLGGNPEEGDAGVATQQKCYTCGEAGHISRNCPTLGGNPEEAGSGVPSQKCYTCGEVGHISRHCPTLGGVGGAGNVAGLAGVPTGPKAGTGKVVRCYKCNGVNHLARDCLSPAGGVAVGRRPKYVDLNLLLNCGSVLTPIP
jgi:cellular nucleic acid-binding protein